MRRIRNAATGPTDGREECPTPDPFTAARRPVHLTVLSPDGVTTLPTGPLDPGQQAELFELIKRKQQEEADAPAEADRDD